MGGHDVAEAANRLSELIDRALAGEDVIITRDGHPVVELRVVKPLPGPITDADLDWLAERRKGRGGRSSIDAGTSVSQMRDEWEK